MLRILFGILAGSALTLMLMLGNLVPTNVNGQDALSSSTNISENGFIVSVREAILSPLLKTAAEADEIPSGKFLNKLVQEYELDKLPRADQDEVSLLDIVPDIKSINEKAMSLPLIEAGKTINDKEIAEFYYDFLKRSGWDIPKK